MIWSDLDSILEANSSFLISSHVGLDGDCVGSQLAMYWYLSSLGKRVVVYGSDTLPDKFGFLADSGVLTSERPAGPFDVLVVLDCSNPSRLGWERIGDMSSVVVNMDHHRDNVLFGTLNIVKKNGAATAELIYEYFTHKKLTYPPHVAEALYTAVMTDTGAFRFSNTNGDILRMCADLCDRGADPAAIYDRVYTSFSSGGLLLQSRIWSTLAFYHNGAVCCMEMPYGLIAELGATYGDSEGMADLTIMGANVEVGVLIKYDEKQTHFSLRSKGRVDVGRIAQNVEGGGGHSSAAGCTMPLPFAVAKPTMLAIIEKAL
jgi:bifunctional oligoribonuclease and PAP phosphatase NrnA